MNEQTASGSVHKFECDGEPYICDLSTGKVIRTNAAVWDLIEYARVLPLPQLVSRFRATYSLNDILDAVATISMYERTGLLATVLKPPVEQSTGSKPRVFVFHELAATARPNPIGYRQTLHHVAGVAALASEIETLIPVPDVYEREFAVMNFGTTIPWRPERGFAQLADIRRDYDLILDLAVDSGALLPLYGFQDAPIVTLYPGVYVPSRNSVLAKGACMRACDAMVFESSWQAKWAREALNHAVRCEAVSSGITPNEDASAAKSNAREQVSDATESEAWRTQPIVGLFMDAPSPSYAIAVWELAKRLPQVCFLVLDGTIVPGSLRNLYSIPRPEAALWWMCLDVLCVNLGWSVSLPFILIATSAGAHVVVVDSEGADELSNACSLIRPGSSADIGDVLHSDLAATLDRFFSDPTFRETASNQAKVAARRFSLKRWKNRLSEVLREPLLVEPSARMPGRPILFHRMFDQATATIRTEATILSDNTRLPCREGILEALRDECTPVELDVLRRFLNDLRR